MSISSLNNSFNSLFKRFNSSYDQFDEETNDIEPLLIPNFYSAEEPTVTNLWFNDRVERMSEYLELQTKELSRKHSEQKLSETIQPNDYNQRGESYLYYYEPFSLKTNASFSEYSKRRGHSMGKKAGAHKRQNIKDEYLRTKICKSNSSHDNNNNNNMIEPKKKMNKTKRKAFPKPIQRKQSIMRNCEALAEKKKEVKDKKTKNAVMIQALVRGYIQRIKYNIIVLKEKLIFIEQQKKQEIDVINERKYYTMLQCRETILTTKVINRQEKDTERNYQLVLALKEERKNLLKEVEAIRKKCKKLEEENGWLHASNSCYDYKAEQVKTRLKEVKICQEKIEFDMKEDIIAMRKTLMKYHSNVVSNRTV